MVNKDKSCLTYCAQYTVDGFIFVGTKFSSI